MVYVQEEIEQAMDGLNLLTGPAKVSTLAMVQSHICRMMDAPKFRDVPEVQSVFRELLEWIKIPIYEEMGKLGLAIEESYDNIRRELIYQRSYPDSLETESEEGEAGRAHA